MKGILEFDLNDPDEQQKHLRCVLSTKMADVLWEIHNNAYQKLEKEGKISYNKGVFDVIEHIRDLMDDDGIVINELIN